MVYAGHDVNVEFLRMLLGATWGSETGPFAPDSEPYSVAVLVRMAVHSTQGGCLFFIISKTQACRLMSEPPPPRAVIYPDKAAEVQLLDRGDAEYWVRASVVAPSLAQRAAGCAAGLDTYR